MVLEKLEKDFSKYEIARILGARALQISMNAPLLIKISKEDLEKVKYDALKIAEIEFESGVLPISVKKPFPERKAGKLKRVREMTVSEDKLDKRKEEEEEEIAKEGEIMGLVNPEEESDETSEKDNGEEE
ncbi:MAG: DNA-directed RNA polymerase subunit K [Candidatus Pacearchaeota archaeon]